MSEHSHPDFTSLDGELGELRRAVAGLEPPASIDATIARAIAGRVHPRRHWRVAAFVSLALAATVSAVLLVHPSFAPEPANPTGTAAGMKPVEGRTEAGTAAFVPLVSLGELERSHDTLVIALEMPRTSLAEFGVPVNPARAADTVPTELLIRPDGAVLAIRFAR